MEFPGKATILFLSVPSAGKSCDILACTSRLRVRASHVTFMRMYEGMDGIINPK
jgi:hypothetical protein